MSKDQHSMNWVFPILRKRSHLWKVGCTFAVSAVGLLNKFIVTFMNSHKVHRKEVLLKLIEKRNGIPLITVSNHHSCMDDPGVWGASLLGWRHLCDRNVMRWSLAAHDICFTKDLHSWFFMLGKCVPIVRGGGIDQEAMVFCGEMLSLGHWVHVFPEGKVNMTKENMRFKWGVGHLIWECDKVPIVLPFWHVGMDSILPNVEPYVPRIGKKMTMNVGDPIELKTVISSLRRMKANPMTARKVITDIIQHELTSLKTATEELHK